MAIFSLLFHHFFLFLNICASRDMWWNARIHLHYFPRRTHSRSSNRCLPNTSPSSCGPHILGLRVVHTIFNSIKARVGHRTAMDVLIPLVEVFAVQRVLKKLRKRRGGWGGNKGVEGEVGKGDLC
ncbi:hypothetical protein DL96DRAFT_1269532 [Flagelloscypha sp. PMI_526]|nr:hypothetical protein DL96DRAFT_1269532 [Flagelloscypha sp. PMI_526]